MAIFIHGFSGGKGSEEEKNKLVRSRLGSSHALDFLETCSYGGFNSFSTEENIKENTLCDVPVRLSFVKAQYP